MNIETLARTHWWTRAKVYNPKLQADLCMGAEDAAAQHARDTVEVMWQEVRETEVAAMQAALASLSLADVLQSTGIAKA